MEERKERQNRNVEEVGHEDKARKLWSEWWNVREKRGVRNRGQDWNS